MSWPQLKLFTFHSNCILLYGRYQGELALAFGDLLRRIWAPDNSPVVPRHFKAKLARFAPQFSGYNQHDSQVTVYLFSEYS